MHRLTTILNRHILAPRRPGVDLPGPADSPVGVAVELVPVGDPPGNPPDREHDREHVERDADRAEDDARVEIDVGIELPLEEVLVRQRDRRQLLGDVQERVGHAQRGQQASRPSARGSWPGDRSSCRRGGQNPSAGTSCSSPSRRSTSDSRHPCGSSRASRSRPCWPRHATDPRAHRPRRTPSANRLAPDEPTMRTVEVEQFCSWSACRIRNRLKRLDHLGRRLVAVVGLREHHVQEVAAVAQLGVGILHRLADRHLVAERRDRADLAHEDGHGGQEPIFVEVGVEQLRDGSSRRR